MIVPTVSRFVNSCTSICSLNSMHYGFGTVKFVPSEGEIRWNVKRASF